MNLLYKLGDLRKLTLREVLTGAALSVVSAALLGISLPFLGSYVVDTSTPSFGYHTEMIGGGDIMEPLHETENPIVNITFPERMKISETRRVSAKLEEVIPSVGLLQGRSYSTLTYSASLSSPSFVIAPTNIL